MSETDEKLKISDSNVSNTHPSGNGSYPKVIPEKMVVVYDNESATSGITSVSTEVKVKIEPSAEVVENSCMD
ncbi:MAG: hypothetical protein NUK65_01370, partial [Firmicutes bacterium]|nr:hypothetical protein [Bacillota bacterium]